MPLNSLAPGSRFGPSGRQASRLEAIRANPRRRVPVRAVGRTDERGIAVAGAIHGELTDRVPRATAARQFSLERWAPA
jgi:hypothetical protein